MSTAGDLFYLTIEGPTGSQLLAITGSRETTIEASLRVILDAAPSWEMIDQGRYPRPMFKINCIKVAR